MQSKPHADNPFACPNCGAMQSRYASRAGLPVVCFDCGANFVIGVPNARPVQDLPAGSDAADEGDVYELDILDRGTPQRHSSPRNPYGSDSYELEPPLARGPTPMFSDEELRPAPRQPVPSRPAVSLEPVGYDADAAREARLHQFRHAPDAPPKIVFLSGVFDFPIYPGVWQRWITMAAGMIVCAQVVIPCLRLLGVLSDEGVGGEAILGLVMGVPSLLVILIAGGYTTACLLAVVEDTASGCDRIQEWPGLDWRDWAAALRYPLVAGLGSLLAGSVFEQLAGEWNLAADLAAMIVFPILLLSSLETGSALLPISGPILRTCKCYWWVWLLFYAETLPILLVWSWIVRLVTGQILIVALLIAMPITIAALLIYARLLGRLAWYTGWEEDEEEEGLDDSESAGGS